MSRARVEACAILALCLAGQGFPSAQAPVIPPAAGDRLSMPAVTRVTAKPRNDKSSDGRPFTAFEYDVPTPRAVPHIIAIDSEDHVWFSESGGRFARNFIDAPAQSRIGRLDQGGTISEWSLDAGGSSPMGVAFDRAKNLWIAERLGNRITRLAPNGAVTRFAVPTPNAWPTGLAIDSKGRPWFTETEGNKVGYVDPVAGVVHEFPLPVASAKPTGIAVDQSDRIWIAERDGNAITRFDPDSARFVRHPVPTPDAKPCGVVVDAANNVWFSERNAGKLGTIATNGAISEYSVGDRFSGPFILAVDRRGDIWFSELFADKVGRFDRESGAVSHYPVQGPDAYVAGIAVDSKGNVWFAAQGTNRIGVIVRTDLGYLSDARTPGSPSVSARHMGEFRIDEFNVPTANALPGIVAVDGDDRVWFTEMGGGWVGPGFPPGSPGSRIGYVERGRVYELPLPSPESGPTSIARDPCGPDLWFSLRAANKIARLRDMTLTEYDIPVPNGYPIGIAVDFDHNVWVALSEANQIGRRTPSGQWRFLSLPTPDAQPRTVYVDRQNRVWFAEKTGNHLGLVDKTNWSVRQWLIPTKMAWPLSLVDDDAGRLWFAEMRSDKLGVFEPATGRITEYDLPVQSAPFKLVYDRVRQAIWISTVFYNAILRFDLPSRQVTAVYRIPAEGAWIGGLDMDSKSCLWFTEQFANRIGRLCVTDQPTDPMPGAR
ncbi:MAG: virginiamycin B lyase family protein [Vicinamibacterales bacterium]